MRIATYGVKGSSEVDGLLQVYKESGTNKPILGSGAAE